VTLTGDITPSAGNSLYLTAVKGGDLVVASNLGSTVPSLVVGQANSFDAQGGTVELQGHNTFTGGTHILGGTLLASASSAFGTGAVTVENKATLSVAKDVLISNPLSLSSGARLSGTGTLASPGGVSVATNAILSPGGSNTIGTLSFETGLNLGAGGALEFDIKSLTTGAGKGWDLINVSSGELSLSASAASPRSKGSRFARPDLSNPNSPCSRRCWASPGPRSASRPSWCRLPMRTGSRRHRPSV